MSEYEHRAHAAEALRRAVALLAASVHDVPELDDPEWLWGMLGDNGDERYATVVAILSVFTGTIEGIGADSVEVVQFMASQVDEF